MAAAAHHAGLIGRLNRGSDISRPSAGAISIAITLAVLEIAMAVYFFLTG